MSTQVTQIHGAIKSGVASVLGASFHELQDTINLEANNLRVAKNGYAVKHGAIISAAGVTRVYTTDQVFEIILSQTNPRKDNDTSLQTTINELYDLADSIFVELLRTKLNLPGVVLNVFNPSITAPEFVNGKEFTILRFRVVVKFRNVVNS